MGTVKRFRTIYMIEVFDDLGELRIRRYARNRKVADKIVRSYVHTRYLADYRLLNSSEHYHVYPEWVEG